MLPVSPVFLRSCHILGCTLGFGGGTKQKTKQKKTIQNDKKKSLGFNLHIKENRSCQSEEQAVSSIEVSNDGIYSAWLITDIYSTVEITIANITAASAHC